MKYSTNDDYSNDSENNSKTDNNDDDSENDQITWWLVGLYVWKHMVTRTPTKDFERGQRHPGNLELFLVDCWLILIWKEYSNVEKPSKFLN